MRADLRPGWRSVRLVTGEERWQWPSAEHRLNPRHHCAAQSASDIFGIRRTYET